MMPATLIGLADVIVIILVCVCVCVYTTSQKFLNSKIFNVF